MKPRIPEALGALTIVLALVAAGCGGDDGSSGKAASPSTVASSGKDKRSAGATTSEKSSSDRASRSGSTVKVMNSRYGRMLFDGRGRALYLFTRDRGRTPSRCYGACAEAWPPFYTSGNPRAGSGAKAAELGTTKRRNGRTQVTYNGHPLYYYVTDKKPGQVTCQNVEEFSGLWLVVSPSGRAIR